ncbi:MAG TPA: phenylacetate--CoA ligase, partial [Cytophagales bacterium]|nr:phenylacetate--CoA ligase [Cytophagales bacterium]
MMYQAEIETLPLDQLRDLQNKRLRTLLPRMLAQVPFYREHWAGIDIGSIKTVDDLPKLPFTKKDHLRQEYPFGLFAVPTDQIARIHASSGTTGKPTVVGYTKADLALFDTVVARSLAAAGARP